MGKVGVSLAETEDEWVTVYSPVIGGGAAFEKPETCDSFRES